MACVAALVAVTATHAGPVSGEAHVIDGDTLHFGATKVRLVDIDAPETSQQCTQADGQRWACGLAATRLLTELTADRQVRCTWTTVDRYGRALATCTAGGKEVIAAMVEAGLALAYRRYSTRYVPHEEQARAAKAGMWAGKFDTPEAHRRAEAAKAAKASQDCPVKGNVNRKGQRIYHTSASKHYAKLRINEAEGDRCFSTTKQAEQAGASSGQLPQHELFFLGYLRMEFPFPASHRHPSSRH